MEEALAHPEAAHPQPGRIAWLIIPENWEWHAGRRQQWQEIMVAWNRASNIAALLEITSADNPDTLLWAEGVPQLLWVAGGNLARGRDIRERMVILQNARCKVVGALLNREVKLFFFL